MGVKKEDTLNADTKYPESEYQMWAEGNAEYDQGKRIYDLLIRDSVRHSEAIRQLDEMDIIADKYLDYETEFPTAITLREFSEKGNKMGEFDVIISDSDTLSKSDLLFIAPHQFLILIDAPATL